MEFRKKSLEDRSDAELSAMADNIIQIVNKYEVELNAIGDEMRRRLGYIALGDMELMEATC